MTEVWVGLLVGAFACAIAAMPIVARFRPGTLRERLLAPRGPRIWRIHR
ncbi:hypothetical protein [Paraburkholderia sp. J12]|nr:hypothetical protein [Paraburkholderia sp. J12]